jgi:hypothetical protein
MTTSFHILFNSLYANHLTLQSELLTVSLNKVPKNQVTSNLHYREVITFVDWFMALCFTVTCAPPAVRRIRILPMNQYARWPIMFGMKYLQYTDALPLHADISRTDRRGSDLPFKAVLQEYLQFLYKYFRLFPPFGGYYCKLCSLKNPRRKITRIKIGFTCWPNTTADNSVLEDIGQRLHRHTCSVGSSRSY